MQTSARPSMPSFASSCSTMRSCALIDSTMLRSHSAGVRASKPRVARKRSSQSGPSPVIASTRESRRTVRTGPWISRAATWATKASQSSSSAVIAKSSLDAYVPEACWSRPPCSARPMRLATRHRLVALEDLRTRGMTASAKGTVEQPGSNVRQKAGLNRSILDKGWHAFELALHNVARYTGTKIVKVPAAYTSQRCSACCSVDPESRESQAVFRCTTCGHEEHADVNAAKNVLADGLSVSACGDLGASRSVKQEPAGNREGLLLQPA